MSLAIEALSELARVKYWGIFLSVLPNVILNPTTQHSLFNQLKPSTI